MGIEVKNPLVSISSAMTRQGMDIQQELTTTAPPVISTCDVEMATTNQSAIQTAMVMEHTTTEDQVLTMIEVDQTGMMTTADHTRTMAAVDHTGTMTAADHMGTTTAADHTGTMTMVDHAGTMTTADHMGTTATADMGTTTLADTGMTTTSADQIGTMMAVAAEPGTASARTIMVVDQMTSTNVTTVATAQAASESQSATSNPSSDLASPVDPNACIYPTIETTVVGSATSNTSPMENSTISTLDNLSTNSVVPNVGVAKKTGIMRPNPHSTTAR